MTDKLRKAAQDVVNSFDNNSFEVADITYDAIEALREALQAEPEPVATVACDTKAGATAFCYFTKDVAMQTPLYTTSPSVNALIAEAIEAHDNKNLLIKSVNMRTQAQPYLDALIAEIEAVVKCAETVTDGDTGDTVYIGEAYPEDDVKAVIDKYRSKP